MGTIEHSVLPDTEAHEPKGISGASANEIYIADGLGSGSWTAAFQYANINTVESDAVTISSIGTTAQTLPFANDGEESTLVADSANNRITVPNAGVYYVSFTTSFSTNATADAGLYEFKLMDDGAETGVALARQMSGSSDTGSAAFSGLVQLDAGSHVTVQVESDEGGDSDDIDLYTASLVVFKVG